MTTDPANRTWLAQLRRAFPNLFRQRLVAVIEPERVATPKLEPIAKILSDAGRERGAPAEAAHQSCSLVHGRA